MSAFCLNLHTSTAAISAPPELESDCMAHLLDQGNKTPQETGGFQGHSLLHTGSGGLGMALEEELAMLTGEQDDEEEEEELSELETPVMGQNTDFLLLFRQKEKDLVLAAKLGKALLERNQDLTKQYEKMNKDLNDKLEHLEQEKHELRRRLENKEGEWEDRVAELETDVQQLQGELERHQVQLREADRDKSTAIRELSEQNHRLLEQLNRIKMLSERKRELEDQVNAVLEENELLQNTVDDLREGTLVLEKQYHEKVLQLRQSQLELQEVRVSHRHLSARFEEFTEERSLQGLSPNPASLLCEIEQSMEQEEQEQEREQLRLQLWEAYCQVRSLVSHLRGNDITDSALSTDSSMDESSETSSAKDVPMGSLHASLLELRRLTQNLLDGNESTGSRRSDEEALEDQVRKLGEELRGVRELYEAEQDRTRNSQEEVLQLHNQIAMLSVEMCSVQEESERMRAMSEARNPSEQLQSAIQDRDDAISKKKVVETELAKCKIDIMSLNSQLLDAIQQKLNLSQQLEAWQDDMHSMIDQQLMEKHQEEWRVTPYSLAGSPGGPSGQSSRRAHRFSDGDKRLFSFFKKN
ncbi:BICD family-like cargo adapter 1 isoform X5 [Salvelinus fontinalis]|uniref:BICD family-like cargo adapter 1 isoform X5 n=1 Tax=Salvelinus fontinalis TaxID=8038 RepID=UPI002485C7AD|nr:BICD family-like cargo adapter 1 isoform X5 [Salvelinus fontinalis]